MEARKLSKSKSDPFQVSLRIRHPTMDPAEISRALQFEPEHCFKAGEARPAVEGTMHLRHTQTYWLAPVSVEGLKRDEPSFLQYFADKAFGQTLQEPAAHLEAMQERLKSLKESYGPVSLEGQLFSLLARLNTQHEFLQRVRAEGGDISILVVMVRREARSFTMSEAIARFLAKLGIAVEFEFVSG